MFEKKSQGDKTDTNRMEFSDWLWLLAVAGIGSANRINHLSTQVIMGDEMHALYRALLHPMIYNFTHFQSTDNCIPLTLYYQWVLNSFGLSEAWMRFPMLLSGTISLILIPHVLGKVFGRGVGLLLAFLLSFSLVHIYYSRFARPYVIVQLLEFIAMASYFVWLKRPRVKFALIYAISIISAIFFHLSAILFLLSTQFYGFAYMLWSGKIRSRSDHTRPTWNMFWGIVLAVTIGLALLLGPAFFFSYGNLEQILGKGKFDWATVSGYAAILAGTNNVILKSIFFLFSALGLYGLFKKYIVLGIYALFLIFLPLVMAILVHPYKLEVPFVLVRYTIGNLPLILALFALGIREIPRLFSESLFMPDKFSKILFSAISFCYVSSIFWTSPVPSMLTRPTSFDLSPQIFKFEKAEKLPFSEFYERLTKGPEKGVLIEYPWDWNGRRSRLFYLRQRSHEWRVIGAYSLWGHDLFNDPRLHMANCLFIMNPEHIAGMGAQFLIVHKNIDKEFKIFHGEVDMNNWPEAEPYVIQRVLGTCTQWFGKAIYEDRYITVFKLPSHK